MCLFLIFYYDYINEACMRPELYCVFLNQILRISLFSSIFVFIFLNKLIFHYPVIPNYPILHKLIISRGSSWSFQRGRSFATISGFQGEVLVQILDFPILSIHFHFSLSSRQGEVSQLRETFSPKSPSKMTPDIPN